MDELNIKKSTNSGGESAFQEADWLWSIFESGRDGYFKVDPEGRIIYANKAYCDMLGYSLEELKRLKDVYEITPSKWHAWEKSEIWDNRLLKTGRTGVYEKEYIRKNKEVFPVELESYTVYEKNSKQKCFWGIVRDIAKYGMVEQSLQKQIGYEKVISEITKLFLKPDATMDTVPMAMEKLLKGARVSRVYIFENFKDEKDELCCRQTYETCAKDIDSQINNRLLQQLPYSVVERWREQLSRNLPIVGCVREFPKDEQDILSPQGVLSIIVFPIFVNGNWYGFMGFDETKTLRIWSNQEVALLNSTVDVFGYFFSSISLKKKLVESEQRFMSVIYSSKDAILIIGKGKFIDCNQATADMLQYNNKEDFLQTHPSELSPPVQSDGRSSIESPDDMMRISLEKGFHRFEWIHRKADKTDFPVEVSLTPILLNGEKVIHCVWKDLTKIKKAERELNENKIRYDDVVSSIPIVIWRYEVSASGEFIESYASSVLESMLGFPKGSMGEESQLFSKSFEHVHPDDLMAIKKKLADGLKEPGKTHSIEYRMIKADGTIIFVESTGFSRVLPNKRIVGYGSTSNITARRISEEKLIIDATILNSTPAAIASCSADGKMTSANPAFMRLWGFSDLSEFQNKLFTELWILDDCMDEVMDALQSKKVWSGELKARRKDGSLFDVEAIATAICDEKGKILQMVSTSIDITNKKIVESKLKSIENKYSLLFKQTNDPLMTLAPPSWRFTSVNPASLELFKVKSEEEFVKLGPWDISPEKQPDGQSSAEKAKMMIEKAMQEGFCSFKWTHMRLGGGPIYCEVYLSRIEDDEQTFLQATVRDITDLTLAEQELMNKTYQLEQFNSLAIGRELKMIELKKRIEELEKKK